MDEATIKVIEQLLAWHDKRVDKLKMIVNKDAATIKIGENIEITDPEVLRGVRIGVSISLSLIGELPISLEEGGDE